jgi:dTDP-4-dehydrorhamnose reductase
VTRVLILGARGMLGAMVARVLGESPNIEAIRSTRDDTEAGSIPFDATRDSTEELLGGDEYEWIINAIGVIRPRIDESDPAGVARAIAVNALFPHRLAATVGPHTRVIQIATDGVFSGVSGPYDENAPHDAADVYARTKSLGEVASPRFLHLRCSVIGPERDPPLSLLGWALSQPPAARITGYTNHRWNGITTWHFARLCEAVIGGTVRDLPSPVHVVPADAVTKAELLELMLEAHGRSDVTVESEPAPVAVDRVLRTVQPEANRRLWDAAGYPDPPPIATMVEELASAERALA